MPEYAVESSAPRARPSSEGMHEVEGRLQGAADSIGYLRVFVSCLPQSFVSVIFRPAGLQVGARFSCAQARHTGELGEFCGTSAPIWAFYDDGCRPRGLTHRISPIATGSRVRGRPCGRNHEESGNSAPSGLEFLDI